MRSARGKHLATDQVDVVVGATVELGRHDVGTEKRGLVAGWHEERHPSAGTTGGMLGNEARACDTQRWG